MARIAQRLVAAGASPERAAAFEQQFITRAGKAGISKPRDIEDAFDQEIAAAATALFPNMFRPPKPGEEGFESYIKGILGPDAFAKAQAKLKPTTEEELYKLYAPDYARALNSTAKIDQRLVKKIKSGETLASLVLEVREDAKANPNNYSAYKADDVVDYVTKVYNDYVDASDDVANAMRTNADENKNILINSLPTASRKFYDFNLPDPKFKYGAETNFEKGTIDFRSNPAVAKRLSDPEVIRAKQLSQVAPAGYMAGSQKEFAQMRGTFANIEKDVFDKFIKTKATPFRDEVQVRQYLKNANLR